MNYEKIDHNFLHQEIKMKKRFGNAELLLYDYFFKTTHIHPKNIISIRNFLFFFVDNEDCAKAKLFLPLLRRLMIEKKILIIREGNTLIKLLYNFFPDPYVHDIKMEKNVYGGKIEITICFLSFFERGIAIGCRGEYIKVVNELLDDNVEYDGYRGFQICIKCKVVDL